MIILHASITDPHYQPIYRHYHVDQTKYHPRQDLVGKCLLARLLNVSLSKVLDGTLFVHGRFGKPYLKDHTLCFNLTNSKNAVILAADRTPIAVDTEKVRPINYHRIHRAFLPAELKFLSRVPKIQQSRLTLKLWTIKEGVLKQVGTGLNGGLRTVQIRLPDLGYAERKGKGYRLIPYNVTSSYVGTIVKDEG